jgi:uncharacterized membrane protein
MKQIKQQRLLKFIYFLSILGIVLSGYLTYLHYSELNSPCDISETFQCSTVKQSDYAEIFRVPVALIGLFGYSFLGLISFSLSKEKLLKKIKEKRVLRKTVSAKSLLAFSVIALGVSLYLTYAEFFLIKAICILCVISQITILGIAISSYHNLKLNKLIKIKEKEGDLKL